MKHRIISLVIGLLTSTVFSATPTTVPDYKLTDENGKTFQLHDLKGSFLFVSFLYTRCPLPKMCPLTITMNKQLAKAWEKEKIATPLKLVIVTLDPDFDTPKVMKKFKDSRQLDSKHFVMVTGDPKVLEEFETNFNAVAIPGDGMISHNAKSALIGPDLLEIKMYKDNEWKVEEIIKDAQAHLARPQASATSTK